MKRQNVFIDCDPGHDDAVALMLLGDKERFNLLGISCSSGNQTVEKTTQNAINLTQFMGIDCPIAQGSPVPLVKESMICPEIHGETGLDGFSFPTYSKEKDYRSGAQLLIDTLLNNEDVTVIVTGPMTNLALALRMDPCITNNIKEVIFMGGSIDNGNISPAAEFNILVDPEAAHIVLSSGLNIKMIGLNVTRQVLVNDNIIGKLGNIKNKISDMFKNLMVVFLKNQKTTFGIEEAPLHDPVTVVSLLDKNAVTFEKMNVEIDLSHGPSYGRTNCDVFHYLKKNPNCFVATKIDVDAYWKVIFDALKRYNEVKNG